MSSTVNHDLPDGASTLIALARIAHREGNRSLEQSALDKLAREYGINVRFTCVESVDRDLERSQNKR